MAETSDYRIDDLDRRLIELLAAEPRLGILGMSRLLGVARATVQSRLDKLLAAGVITGFGPDIDLAALGYDVVAFCTVEVVQGRISDVVEPLTAIPEVLEIYAVAGQGDLFLRVAARSNEHLMQVLEQILQIPEVDRTSTAIGLSKRLPYRVLPLVAAAVG